VAGSLAIVAGLVRDATGFRATPGDVARFSAVVAGRHVGTLKAVFSEVTFPITTVTTRGILFAVAGVVPGLVAFVALLSVPVETASSVAPSRLGTLPREMPRLVAFVTYTPGTHARLRTEPLMMITRQESKHLDGGAAAATS
jgi:hypothetical protein